ncbi:MAG: hypothetical protein AABX01_07120 [Candidatus Micrarchaeota archaeon]
MSPFWDNLDHEPEGQKKTKVLGPLEHALNTLHRDLQASAHFKWLLRIAGGAQRMDFKKVEDIQAHIAILTKTIPTSGQAGVRQIKPGSREEQVNKNLIRLYEDAHAFLEEHKNHLNVEAKMEIERRQKDK